MPSIKDQSTVQAIAREFTSNGRNEEQALIKVGYSKTYARGGNGNRVYSNILVKAAIAKIDKENQVKYEHTYDIAMKVLDRRIAYLEPLAEKGNIQAVDAITRLEKEKNEITGLHKQRFVDESSHAQTLTDKDRALLKSMSKALTDQDLAQGPRLVQDGQRGVEAG